MGSGTTANCKPWSSGCMASTLYGGEWLASHSGRFTTRKGAPEVGDWISPIADLDEGMNRLISVVSAN
jgi:hypothetical protein